MHIRYIFQLLSIAGKFAEWSTKALADGRVTLVEGVKLIVDVAPVLDLPVQPKILEAATAFSDWIDQATMDGKVQLPEAVQLVAQVCDILEIPTQIDVSKLPEIAFTAPLPPPNQPAALPPK